MAIKPIDSMPKPEPNDRMERLKEDVREIVEKRIPMAEIIDPPYGKNTMRERLGKAMRLVIWEYARKYGIRVPGASEVFKIESRKADGTGIEYRWYVKFDVELWERCLRESQPEARLELDATDRVSNIPETCMNCPNHPTNGGSGICNCVLGMPKVT